MNPINNNYTAELRAIQKAFNYIEELQHHHKNFIICSDSLSVLQKLSNNASSKNGLINDTIIKAMQQPDTKLMWIPGHCGVGLNEKADEAAKSAAESGVYIEEISNPDLKEYFKLLKKMERQKNGTTLGRTP